MIKNLQHIIDTKIRPYLGEHGGDIKVLKFENGILEVKFLGQCSGCPSAKFTIEEIVKGPIMKEFPEIKDVVLVNEISEELLDMARKILSRSKGELSESRG